MRSQRRSSTAGCANIWSCRNAISQRARETLTEILKQLKLEPERYEPLKTVSSSSTEIVCNAVLPLPGGGNVTVDYTFYWEGNKVNMKYSVSHSAS